MPHWFSYVGITFLSRKLPSKDYCANFILHYLTYFPQKQNALFLVNPTPKINGCKATPCVICYLRQLPKYLYNKKENIYIKKYNKNYYICLCCLLTLGGAHKTTE